MSHRRKPASGKVVPHLPTLTQRILARTVYLAVHACAATQRFSLHDPHGTARVAHQGHFIAAIWHNRLAFSSIVYRRYLRLHDPTRRVAAMVSASRDGALLTAILEAFNIQAVRGSSSRRGSQAILEMTTCAEQGFDLAITPDGPRGPCYVVQPGIIMVARTTGLPILPLSINGHWKWRLGSWDQFQVPLPFGASELRLGRALLFTPDDPRPIEEFQLELQQELDGITRE